MQHILLVLSSISDLFTRYRPWSKNIQSSFAFLVHPRNIKDIYSKYPLLRYLPESLVKNIFTYVFWPVTVSEVSGSLTWQKKHHKVKGWIISIPITAEQMMKNRKLATRSIISAAKLAEKKGAQIIGLGALTASLTRGGLDIIPHIESGVTTGRIYTSKIITDTVKHAVLKLNLSKINIRIAIVGAAGSIGTACAHILVNEGYKDILLVDVDHKKERLDSLTVKLKSYNSLAVISQSTELSSIISADIVVAATNHPDALIKSEHLKPGAVVVDDAQPSDVDPDVILKRKDVLVLEGGAVHAKGIDPHFNFGLKHKEDIFSCLAETIILSVTGHTGNYQVGEIFEYDIQALNNLSKKSEQIGFTISEFQNFNKVYTESDFSFVRSVINRNNV